MEVACESKLALGRDTDVASLEGVEDNEWCVLCKEDVRGGGGGAGGVTERLGDRVRVRAREASEGNVEDIAGAAWTTWDPDC